MKELERFIPGDVSSKELHALHLSRYRFARPFVIGKAVADIACGSGYGSALIASFGASSVVGIDVSSEAVELASRTCREPNLRFVRGTSDVLKTLPALDVVVSFETIEHVDDYRSFLNDIASALSADGVLLMSTPVRTEGTLETKPGNPFHVREWIPEEFLPLLKEYFSDVELQWQFVYRRLWFPGSRTVLKAFGRVFQSRRTRQFEQYDVTPEPVHRRGIPVDRGYIIAVCKGPSVRRIGRENTVARKA